MKRKLRFLLMVVLTITCFTANASAIDYTFHEKNNDDFYRSTSYEDLYGAYNYGGLNSLDFNDTSLLPGILSPMPMPSIAEHSPTSYETPIFHYPDTMSVSLMSAAPFTDVSELVQSNGSIGTLSIPSLSITMNAYDGTGSQSMNRGLGHFPEMSGWDGNIGLCGHNRGSTFTIGSIKDLNIGDAIQYSTTYGTRTYAVSYVGTISETDWTYLSPTSDNRITLITCLANNPPMRVCVQAIAV